MHTALGYGPAAQQRMAGAMFQLRAAELAGINQNAKRNTQHGQVLMALQNADGNNGGSAKVNSRTCK